jgi:hypothetical protein
VASTAPWRARHARGVTSGQPDEADGAWSISEPRGLSALLGRGRKRQLLLLSGIPGAGKSHFGRWLEETHRYVHLDVEQDGRLTTYHLTDAWNGCFTSLDVGGFVKALHRVGERVVVDWGFPPRFLNVVQRLQAAGFVPWWFDADHHAARRAFVARGDVPLQAFEVQMAAILERWPSIEATFRPNIITTLKSDGSRLSAEVIYKLMCEAKRDDPA